MTCRRMQTAVLIEVPAHELRPAVVVGVKHRGARVIDLAPSGCEKVTTEGLVLGVGDVAEAQFLPAAPRVARVRVGQERGIPYALHVRPAVGRKRGKELGEFARDHRPGVGTRQVWTVGRPYPFIEGE